MLRRKSLRTAIVVVYRQQPDIPRTGLALEYSKLELYLRAPDKIGFIACVLRDVKIQVFRVLGRADKSESPLVEVIDRPEHSFPSFRHRKMALALVVRFQLVCFQGHPGSIS